MRYGLSETLNKSKDCTNITNEDDFSVCGNVLGEEGPLIIMRQGFMLAGGV